MSFRTRALCLLRRRQPCNNRINRACIHSYPCNHHHHGYATVRTIHHAASTGQARPRIAIVGGGPAGLALGLLLHKRGIPFTIFELRQEPSDEELAKPSGMLDLHDESGLAAIRECGLFNQFLQLTGECTEANKVADMHGSILYADEEGLSEHPEISRHALTKLLSSHLPPEVIKWDHKLLSAASVTAPSGATTQTELDYGSDPHRGKQAFDLVIGADGAWSRIRNMLTDIRPHYAGTQNFTATVRHITAKYPHLAALVGRGSFAALGLRHGIMTSAGHRILPVSTFS